MAEQRASTTSASSSQQKKKGRVFTDLSEIFEHNTKESLWLLIEGKVYDVTDFKHPGGKQILLQNAGQDATTQFEDINHSPKADKFMEELYIGDFEYPDDDKNSKGGILENEQKTKGQQDLTERAILAIAVLAFIAFLYLQVV